MILIGSRCGGHDFFVELPGLNPFWIGARDRSDLDILIGEEEDVPKIDGFRIDVWRGCVPGKTGLYTAPYSINGELYIPSDLQYLQRISKRRIRHQYGVQYLKSLWDRELVFLNKDGSFFTRQKMTRGFCL